MLFKTFSAAVFGIDAYLVEVEVDVAPADIREEGSAFDLPMALGLAGCQGTFFGKILDTHVFLGKLSLDGGVRSVRGALSAALARANTASKM